ncbi:MAG: hypothetical protein KUG60_00965 [Gammaproteobacteria bacterium]|nr:hypothetical protein [Gammaproteobacteria bacterium]
MKDPVLITAALLIFPLIPSAVIYLILTPSKTEGVPTENHAQGKYDGQVLKLGKVSLEFNVFGSSATYIVLLCASFFMHGNIEEKELSKLARMAEVEKVKGEQETRRLALKNNQAWLVELPVRLEDKSGTPIEANNGEMKQVRVELLPSSTTAHSNKIKFWVVAQDGGFPDARLSIPGMSLRAQNHSLNDIKIIDHDHEQRKMTGIEPVWITVGDVYSKRGSYEN